MAAFLALLAVPATALALPSLSDRTPLKNPIVLVHGSTASGANLTIGPFDLGLYFNDLPNFLGSNGTEVKVVELPTDASIGERAAVLKNFLDTDMKGKMVNIVGHSLGGLDARYATSILGSNQVASITSIGTPHLGTPLADWAWRQAEKGGVWYWLFRMIGYDLKHRRFLQEITTHGMKRFNEKVKDRPDVRYYSVRTRANFSEGTMSGFLWFTSRWLEGEKHYLTASGHDGMVPFDSQAWGVTLPSFQIDHLAQLNHHEIRFQNSKPETLQLWVNIFDNLHKEGL